jgi:hypothetical protein
MAYGQASPTAFEAETRRLGFEKLSVERHLQDYHKIFSDPRTEAWTYVYLFNFFIGFQLWL